MRISVAVPSILFLFLCFSLSSSCVAQQRDDEQSHAQEWAVQELVELSTEVEQTALDCSHFVNHAFEQVGLEYDYTPSRELYKGKSDAFRRVYRPAAGDLVVWPGHVGIVVDPDSKTFVSVLHSSVRVSSYISPYWRHRGIPRFLRYRLPISNTQLVWDIREATPGRGFISPVE
jgi:hypothetical protein